VRPTEELQILVDPSRPRFVVPHQPVIKLGGGHIRLTNRDRLQLLQVPSVSILMLDGEVNAEQALEKIEELSRGDVALVRLAVVDTGDADHAISIIARLERLEADPKSMFVSSYEEADDSTTTSCLFSRPKAISVNETKSEIKGLTILSSYPPNRLQGLLGISAI
jgi:hypothetical protein